MNGAPILKTRLLAGNVSQSNRHSTLYQREICQSAVIPFTGSVAAYEAGLEVNGILFGSA